MFALVLGVCVLAAGLLLLKGWRSRTGIYQYDVRQDHRFDLSHSRASTFTTRLVGGKLDIPPQVTATGCALLQLHVSSTFLGSWFEPYLEIESANRQWRQPFERGARGLRYVDLTQIVSSGEPEVRVRGRHLKLGDQQVALHCLQSDVDADRQRLLVIGTHPDDAEIAAFGTYAGRDAYVITLTAGEAGDAGPFERFGGSQIYLEKGRNRAWNSVVVPMLGGLGIDRSANLGYFDATLQAMRLSPDSAVRSQQADVEFLDAFGRSHDTRFVGPRTQRRATWKNLVADLEHLVKTIEPEIMIAPYPRLDWHVDHKMSTVALVEALKNLNWREGSLLLYANHPVSSDRYPYGEAGDLVSLLPGVDDIYFDGIVSIDLDANKQARKHMALDAMIDLRANLRVESPRSMLGALKTALQSTITDGQSSYFRQAVRANELFFEVRVSSLYEPNVTQRIFG
jgi:LmbE family N-acetylglucosaminyl deacetylase